MSRKKRTFVKNKELNICASLWAELTNIGFGRALTLQKQAKSITKYDKITSSKSAKGKDFNEHQSMAIFSSLIHYHDL